MVIKINLVHTGLLERIRTCNATCDIQTLVLGEFVKLPSNNLVCKH